MRRVIGLLLLLAPCSLAAPKPDARVEKAVRAVELRAAAEPERLAMETRLRAAQLLKQSHPQLARKLALQVVAQLEKSKDQGYVNYRVTEVLMAIDPAEAERVTASLPGQDSVRDALLGYWMRKEDWGRARAIVRRELSKGKVSSLTEVLRGMKEKDPDGAAALFREALAAFPAKANARDAMSLMQSMGEIYMIDSASVVKAALRLVELAAPEDFDASGPMEMLAEFKVGEKTIKAKSGRETILIPLSMCLAVMDKAAFQKHGKLFAGWAGDLADLSPEKLLKAAEPVRTTYKRRESAKAEARPEPPDYSKLPFAEALAKIRTAPDRVQPLVTLLRRDKLTPAEQETAARAVLEELPRAPAQSRLWPARDLLDLCLDRGLSRWTRPAIDAVLSAAAANPKADVAEAYAEVAGALHEQHIRLRTQPPPLAAQQALLELRQALERNYDFTLASLDGRPYQLRRQRGKVVFLNFWASW